MADHNIPLKPCRCKRIPLIEHAIVKGNLCYMVVCQLCRRHTTLCFRKESAIKEWNTMPEKEKS